MTICLKLPTELKTLVATVAFKARLAMLGGTQE